MSKRGRPALLIPTVEWKVRVPADLAAKADLLHLDPVRGSITYGARSALVTELLRGYLDSLAKTGNDGDGNSPINLPFTEPTP
jgi:hypothetical protein